MKIAQPTVQKFYTDNATQLGLHLLAGAGGLSRVIREPTVNRPGLALAGFRKYFAPRRVQVIGNGLRPDRVRWRLLSRTGEDPWVVHPVSDSGVWRDLIGPVADADGLRLAVAAPSPALNLAASIRARLSTDQRTEIEIPARMACLKPVPISWSARMTVFLLPVSR